MTAHDFTYWLQGFAELNEGPPSAEQWQAIRDHLALVFTKVTPQRSAPNTVTLPYASGGISQCASNNPHIATMC